MNRLFSIILTLILILTAFPAAVEFLADGTSLVTFAASVDPNVITANSIQLEYASTTYSGTERTPAVTVKIGDVTLTADVDYTVKYPDDCINAGDKTIIVTGKGDYSGEVKLGYSITPVSCTDNPDIVITASDCYYNGLPQSPELTVKYGNITVPKSDYTIALSDNVEVGTGAKCTVKFRGNYSGERTVSFKILKRRMENFDADIVAKRGQAVSIDLSSLKPAGAIFGNLIFLEEDFTPTNQPKVAFNVLNFTLSPTVGKYSSIFIPMTNIINSEDYRLEFYIEPTDKEIPKLTLKPVTKEYDGDPVSIAEIEDSGSYAFLNGNVVEGKWEYPFWTVPPTLPCESEYYEVMFTPNNPEYSHVYGLVPITVTRKSVPEFKVKAKKTIELGDTLKVTVVGIPEDFDGTVTVACKEEDKVTVLSEEDTDAGRVYTLDFPLENAHYTLEATLDGSPSYASKTVKFEVTVGEPEDEPVDVVTSADMLSELIENAQAGSTVKANKTTLISVEILRAALAKNITIEVKANDAVTYVIEPSKMKYLTALNLYTTGAVIPQVLLDKTGDIVVQSFTTFAYNYGGVSVKTTIKSVRPITCFYLYNTSGELEHITSTPLKGQTVKFELPGSGKYVITTSRVSHISHDIDNDCMITFDDVNAAISIFLDVVAVGGKGTQDQIDAMDFDGDGAVTFEDVNDMISCFLEHI